MIYHHRRTGHHWDSGTAVAWRVYALLSYRCQILDTGTSAERMSVTRAFGDSATTRGLELVGVVPPTELVKREVLARLPNQMSITLN